jgi:hypothetical protein
MSQHSGWQLGGIRGEADELTVGRFNSTIG